MKWESPTAIENQTRSATKTGRFGYRVMARPLYLA